MKKLLTILLTLFLFSSVYAEVRVVDKLEYRDGVAYAVGESEGFSGKLVTTYSNGKKETEINYQDGKQEGLDIWWWRNGNKGRESNYKNGKLNGLETEWYKGGIKQIETNYKDGEKHGLETRWNRNSVKQRETNYTAKQVININISQVVEEQIALLGSEADLNHLDVSEVTDMAGLFEWSDFNGDISKWDVSNVTNMSEMFKSSQFKGDISKWGISNVTDMSGMFSSSQFNSDISKWDVSSVTNMDGMFKDSQFSNDISKWDVSNVTDTEGMYFQSKIVSNARPPSHSNDFKSSSNLIAYRRLNLAQYSEKDKDKGIGKKNRSKSSKKSTGVTSLFIGPDSMKTTVYRDGDIAEQTETVFVDRNHRVEGEKKLREKWRAKWKAAWKEGRTIDDLTKEEFILNPDLERRFSKYRDDAIGLFYSDNKKDREEAVVILRKLAFAGSTPAYYDLIFRSPDSSYEEDNKFRYQHLFGDIFDYGYTKRQKAKINNEMMILAKDNPNNNADQNELIRSLLLLSQKKFQHFHHFMDFAGRDMFLSYMILSMPGSQSDAKAEYYLAARLDRDDIGVINDYLLTNEEIVRNLEKEAEENDTVSMMLVLNTYNPKGMYKTLEEIFPPNDKKAIYYSKKIIKHVQTNKGEVFIKRSPSLVRKAYETLRELKDESMLKEVNLYFKDIDEAKVNRQKEIRKQGQFCTVSFMEGGNPKRKTYTYYKTEDCLAHIKHADENGYLNKGRFKNGNNPLIFWGPQGTYEGTKSLMKNHKPLNK